MAAVDISTTEAKQDKLFYVVANLVIVNPKDHTVLLLKRHPREKVYPEKWAFPGGKLEHADVAAELERQGNQPLDGVDEVYGLLAKREAKEECGLEVKSDGCTILKNKVFVRPDCVPVVMVSILAEYIGGEVELEEGGFTDYAWVRQENINDYDRIPGSEEEVNKAFSALAG